MSSSKIALLIVALAAPALNAQVLLSTVSPTVAVPGLTTVTVTGSGFPATTITPANVAVTLTPATSGAAQTVSTVASSIATVTGTIRRLSFTVPSSLAVSAPTPYLISISDQTDSFRSTNNASITINPSAQVTGVAPNSGTQGQTIPVTITGQYSNFLQGLSTVSAGTGITVSNVAVANPTSLTATFVIDRNAGLGSRAVTVSSGGESATLASGFTVNAGQALITGVVPASAQQGQTLNIAVTGTSTNFLASSTTATLGAGFAINSVTVADATHLTVNVSVSPTSATGSRTLTLTTGTAIVSAAFSVTPGPATLSTLAPNAASQGQALTVLVTGFSTHFATGTTADFGPGVTVTSVTPTSATSASIGLTVQDNAPQGKRDVTLTTAGEVASLAGGFAVNQSAPVILSVTPNSAAQGQTIQSVAIVGRFSHFINSTSVASFGAGTTVSALTVTDPTHATAKLVVDPLASPGSRDVIVTTATETITIAAAFTVQPGAASISSLNPNTGQQGRTLSGVIITGQGTHFLSATPGVTFANAGVIASNVTVTDNTHLTLTVTITGTAALGPTNVTVATGAESAIGAGAFTVAAPQTPVILSLNPASGLQGQILNGVSITGSSTHFTQGTPAVTFSVAGITATSIQVTDDTHLKATLTIAGNALPGLSNVTVATGTETANGTGLFTVVGAPKLISANPSSVQQGQPSATAVTITGSYTHFTQGRPTITFSSTGIVASAISVTDDTHLTATLTISFSALVGPSDVTVTTGSEIAVGTGLIIITGRPSITSVNPASAQQGQMLTSFSVTGASTRFAQGTTTLTFSNSGITASALTVTDSTHLTATLTVAPSAAIGFSAVTATTGSEIATATGLFSITAGTPIITTVTPSSGLQGQTLTAVAVTGAFTHFTQAPPVLTFSNPGITASAIFVTDNTHLTATITILPTATLGASSLTISTGTETATGTGLFTVTNGPPTITILSPSSGIQGQTLTGVAITGSLTHFTQAAPAVTFSNTGVTASAISVIDATHLTATLTIAGTAPLGASNVTVSTGTETASGTGLFTVISGTPAITTVNPASGGQGQTLTAVAITGLFTHFTQATPVVTFSNSGITASAISVIDNTHLTATLTISAAATAGASNITVATGTEVASGTGLFTIGSNPPIITSLTPSTAQQGQQGISFAIVGQFTHFAQATSTANFGAGITVSSLTVNSATSATALLNIDPAAATGSRTLTITTGSETATLVNALTVTAAPPSITITAPANLTYTNISPTTVNGTVSDPTATVVINGLTAPVANGSFSLAVPLAEGPNILTATATSTAGTAGTSSIQVTLDTTPPHVTITNPPDQFVTTSASLTVSGSINDIVVGTVNAAQAQVTVNGTAAQVSNRMFLANNIALQMGANTIQAVGRDQAGNAATTQITVTRQAPAAQPQISLISGDGQTGTIGSILPTALVVALKDASGNPVANQPVIFKVDQNNGMVASGGQPAATVVATTNSAGQAQAQWTLGGRAGAGGNTVEAYAVGFNGTALFTASGTQGPAGMIVIDTGNNQTGEINKPLAKPLIAVVIDAGNNRLAGVPVTFTVKQGGGNIGGQQSTTIASDSDGRVSATLTLGSQEGTLNNLIEANFSSNQSYPAAFTSSARAAGAAVKTVITGVVLDNSNQPIPGVTVRAVLTNTLNSNSGLVSATVTVKTDAQGQFSISPAPVGFVKLLVDGSTAQRTGTFPTLDYDLVTIAGQTNRLELPIFLLPLKTANQLCVTPTTGGGTLTVPEAPGFSLTFAPGQVTFPGGSKTGCVSVTVVHPDKIPMTPGFGQQPRFIVTIQPSGALFNPPAPISLPNVDGLAPRAIAEMYSFDHDIGSFVAIGTGAVSDDGLTLRSSAGVGVIKAGWHCGGNPNQSGAAATCPTCTYCQGTTCTPQGNGTACGNGGACQFTGQTTAPTCMCPAGQVFNTTTSACVSNAPCLAGYSLANGQCCQGATCMPPQCPAGLVFDPSTGTCSSPCPPGYTLVAGQCCQGNSCIPQCPSGQIFNTSTGTCQPQCGTCNGGNPCIDSSCGANNQCVPSPNQFCQNACTGQASGAACSVRNISGVCEANGTCNLCGALGSGASCSCSGGAVGTCNVTGQCTVNGQNCNAPAVQLSWRTNLVGGTSGIQRINLRQGNKSYSSSILTALPSLPGGSFSWLSTDQSVLKISPNGSTVTIEGLQPGQSTLFVSYSLNGQNVGTSVLVNVSYPVIFVHGISSGSSTWSAVTSALLQNDLLVYDPTCRNSSPEMDFCTVDFDTDPRTNLWRSQTDFVTEGTVLSSIISSITSFTGAAKVTLVAHSMGGLVSRSAIQSGQAPHVAKLITLGTPHQGSAWANVVASKVSEVGLVPAIGAFLINLDPLSPGTASLKTNSPQISGLNAGVGAMAAVSNTSIVGIATSVQSDLAIAYWAGVIATHCTPVLPDAVCPGLLLTEPAITQLLNSGDLAVWSQSQDLNTLGVFSKVVQITAIHTAEPGAVAAILAELGF